MIPKTIFVPYRPKTFLNKSKRADHWIWTRYSAYPYLGCQHSTALTPGVEAGSPLELNSTPASQV